MKHVFAILWSLFTLSLLFLGIEIIINFCGTFILEKQFLVQVSLVLIFLILCLNATKRNLNIIFQIIISLGFLGGSLLYYHIPLAFWLISIIGIITIGLLLKGIMNGESFHIGYYKSFSQKESLILNQKEKKLNALERKLEDRKKN